MSEEDFAWVTRVGSAVAALRDDVGASRTPAPLAGSPDEAPSDAARDALAPQEWLPSTGYTERGPDPAVPAVFDLSTEIGAIVDGLEDAGIGPAEVAPLAVPTIRPPSRNEAIAPIIRRDRRPGLLAAMIACALLATVGWRFGGTSAVCQLSQLGQADAAGGWAVDTVADRIVFAESSGNATAKNKLSSATGAGQFLDGTWLDMIRAYRRDLAGLSDPEILKLRSDPDLSREMVARFAEQNAAVLASHCMPVTPGTLYLSHFAGSAGAAAVLSAPGYADAATTMAEADSTGRTTREMIVTANPFMHDFTNSDLTSWAERRMSAHRHSQM